MTCRFCEEAGRHLRLCSVGRKTPMDTMSEIASLRAQLADLQFTVSAQAAEIAALRDALHGLMHTDGVDFHAALRRAADALATPSARATAYASIVSAAVTWADSRGGASALLKSVRELSRLDGDASKEQG